MINHNFTPFLFPNSPYNQYKMNFIRSPTFTLTWNRFRNELQNSTLLYWIILSIHSEHNYNKSLSALMVTRASIPFVMKLSYFPDHKTKTDYRLDCDIIHFKYQNIRNFSKHKKSTMTDGCYILNWVNGSDKF